MAATGAAVGAAGAAYRIYTRYQTRKRQVITGYVPAQRLVKYSKPIQIFTGWAPIRQQAPVYERRRVQTGWNYTSKRAPVYGWKRIQTGGRTVWEKRPKYGWKYVWKWLGWFWKLVKSWVQTGWQWVQSRKPEYHNVYTIVGWKSVTEHHPRYEWRQIQAGTKWITTGWRKTYKTIMVPAWRWETYQKPIYDTIEEVVGEEKVVEIDEGVDKVRGRALMLANVGRAARWLQGGRNRVIKFMHRGMLYTAASVAALLLLVSQCGTGGGGTPLPTPTHTPLPTFTPTVEMIAVPCTATPQPTSTGTLLPTATSTPSATGTPTATMIWSTSTPIPTLTLSPTPTPAPPIPNCTPRNENEVCIDPAQDDERTILAHIVMGEGGTSIGEMAMRNIAQVIINRINSDAFPDTPLEVVSANRDNTEWAFDAYNLSAPRDGHRLWNTALSLADAIIAGYDVNASEGMDKALYFASCINSDNLERKDIKYIHVDRTPDGPDGQRRGLAQYYYDHLPNPRGCETIE